MWLRGSHTVRLLVPIRVILAHILMGTTSMVERIGSHHASCAGGPEFKSCASQILTVHRRPSIYAGSCVTLLLGRGDGHRELVTYLSANTARIMKDLIL